MKSIFICFFMFIISLPAFADDLFTDSKLMDIRVFNADKESKIAWARDKDNNESEIYLGDEIGIDHAVVTVIEETHIKVKKNKTITTIKVMKNTDSNAVKIDAFKADGL